MAQLASVDDLNASQGTNFGGADPVAVRLLELASSMVQIEAQQTFAVVADDTVLVYTQPEGLWLPERRVRAIGEISAYLRGGVTALLDPAGYEVAPDGWVVSKVWDYRWVEGHPFKVTYEHGYDPIPDDVVTVVCNIVGRMLDNPTQADDEQIGAYSATYSRAGTDSSSAFSKDDRATIRKRYRPGVRSLSTAPVYAPSMGWI